jgi:hypothetical protein
MATGLTHWAADADAPPAVRDLRDKRLAMLTRTLATLNDQASWTPAGARFFAALKAQELKLQTASKAF